MDVPAPHVVRRRAEELGAAAARLAEAYRWAHLAAFSKPRGDLPVIRAGIGDPTGDAAVDLIPHRNTLRFAVKRLREAERQLAAAESALARLVGWEVKQPPKPDPNATVTPAEFALALAHQRRRRERGEV